MQTTPDTLAEFDIFTATIQPETPAAILDAAHAVADAVMANAQDQFALHQAMRDMLVILSRLAQSGGTTLAVLMCGAMQPAEV